MPDDLWRRVKDRQAATRSDMIAKGVSRPERAHRPRHLFSGLLTCGCCGGGYTVVGKSHYGCANARNKGTCDNRLTIRREDLENRILTGLKDQLLHPDLIAEFVSAYREEFNRLSAHATKGKAKAERDLAKVIRQIDRIVEAIAEGMFHDAMKAKMDDLETRRAVLEADLVDASTELPVLLHPGLSEIYRGHVADLASALNDPEMKAESTSIIRGLLSEVRLIPEGDGLAIELVGELAGLLALGQTKTASEAFASGRSVTMVAGVGFEPTTFRL